MIRHHSIEFLPISTSRRLRFSVVDILRIYFPSKIHIEFFICVFRFFEIFISILCSLLRVCLSVLCVRRKHISTIPSIENRNGAMSKFKEKSPKKSYSNIFAICLCLQLVLSERKTRNRLTLLSDGINLEMA